MRRLTIIAALIFSPFAAAADGHADALARLEAGTEAMTENLLDFYVDRAPELAGFRPDMTWDDAFREAGQCLLDGLNAEGGDAAVASYLAALEEFSKAEIVNFTDLTTLMPDALATDVVLDLSSVCGTISLGSERMAASGLTRAFQAEGVMAKVLAPAE